MAYSDLVLADSPLLYLPLDGSVTNSGSASVTLTDTGMAYEASSHGQSLSLAGADYIDVTGLGNFASDKDYSVELWFKMGTQNAARYLFMAGSFASQQAVAAYASATVNGDVTLYARYGSTATSQVITGMNDNVWHHLVFSATTSGIALYLDGTQVGTLAPAGTPNIANLLTIANDTPHTASAKWVGSIDEFAVYPAALSAAQVAAHYAGAPAATNVTVDVAVATATAQSSDVTVDTNTLTTTLTSNADRLASGAGAATAMDIAVSTGYMNFDMSALAGATIVAATLNLNQTSASTGGTSAVGRVVGAWNESSVTGTTLDNSVTAAFANATGAKSVDVTSIAQAIMGSGALNGFWLSASGAGSTTIATKENATVALRPTLTVIYEAAPTNVDLDTPTASLSAPDVTVEAARSVDVALDTPTASLAAPDATGVIPVGVDLPVADAITAAAYDVTVETIINPDAIIDVDAAVVSFAAPDAEGSIPVSADLDVAEAITATANDVEVEVRFNAIADLDTPNILIYKKELESVNGDPIVLDEGEDPYFNTVMLNDPTIWYRFNDLVNPVKPRVYGGADVDNFTVNIANGVVGLNGGIGDRKYVNFNGTAYFAQPVATEDERHTRNGTLEFSIRTDKRNQFVMRMDDVRTDVISPVDTPARDINIVDGKLQFVTWSGNTPTTVFTSFTDIADNEWHHIVLTFEEDRDNDNYSTDRINLYVDGELDIRRYKSVAFGFPDWIGGRPAQASGGVLSQTSWFVGDMTEVVYYADNYFVQDQVYRQYDTLIGRQPVYLDAPKIQTKASEPVVKGNKPRVLVLDFGTDDTIVYSGGAPIENADFTDTSGRTNGRFSGFGKWRLRPEWSNNDPRQKVGPYKPADIGDMLVYTVSVGPTSLAGQMWTDERLDTPRLLDLEKDLNMDDYDIISIADYPQGSGDVSTELTYNYGVEFGGPTFTQQREYLMEQVRKQVVAGKGLFVNDPRSAVDLGIIDRVEYVPEYREGISLDNRLGAVTGLYDAFGGVGKRGPASTDVARNARYNDQHANMFQRVRNLVPGLTDTKGYWIHTDSSLWRNVDPLDTPNSVFKYRHEDRTDTGLLLDDEFYLIGGNGLDQRSIYGRQVGFTLDSDYRVNGWVGTPLSAIKTGVAVTTFGAKVGMKDKMVDNPYKDHAVTIAVRPGDTLKGETIAGKVYVNFTEAYNKYAHIVEAQPREIIPENRTSADGKVVVPEADLYWTYSETRGDYTGDTIIFNSPIDSSNWDTLNEGEKAGSGKSVRMWKWAMMNYRSAFPVETILVAPMARRALDWLVGEIEEDGNATAGAQAAKVTIGANDVTVETTTSVEVTVGAARITTDVQPMPDVTDADATVLLGTPTLTVRAQEFMEIVDLDAASITLNAPDVENDLLNSVDRIYMTMPVHNITLIMEEE